MTWVAFFRLRDFFPALINHLHGKAGSNEALILNIAMGTGMQKELWLIAN
jgi:hypothetical protein